MKLIMTKGLPGSGKTTWAKEQLNKNSGYIRVNKDELRAMLFNSKWSKGKEAVVLKVRDNIVLLALSSGQTVIVDDTNFAPKHEIVLRQFAEAYKADFEIKDFTNVPVETCIERDLKRPNSVGSKVIMKMVNQFLKEPPAKPENVDKGQLAIICDLDGTLAEIGDRSPYDASQCGKDRVNYVIREILSALMEQGYRIILCSGREDKYMDETTDWLADNQIEYDDLFMRPAGDYRKDSVIKQEIYEREIKGKYNVEAIFDDRNQVVEMWRANGLPTFQVAEGDF